MVGSLASGSGIRGGDGVVVVEVEMVAVVGRQRWQIRWD